MNKLELLERRKTLIEEMKQIVNNAKNQKRQLLKVEDTEFHQIKEEIRQLDEQINNYKIDKPHKKMSFLRNLKNINDELQNNLRSELRAHGMQIADNEYIMRAGSPTNGDQIIPTEVNDVQNQLAEIHCFNGWKFGTSSSSFRNSYFGWYVFKLGRRRWY